MADSKPENIGFGGRSDERERPCLIHPCQPKVHHALMRVNIVPTSNAEFKALVRRADARVTAVPSSSVPPQRLSRSLMLKTSVPASKPENKEWVRRADARVTVVLGSSVPPQRLSRSLMLKTSVPTSSAENIGFGGLADARELPCQPHKLKMSGLSHLQKAVDSSKLSNKWPTRLSTTDAVTARDFAQSTPCRARQI